MNVKVVCLKSVVGEHVTVNQPRYNEFVRYSAFEWYNVHTTAKGNSLYAVVNEEIRAILEAAYQEFKALPGVSNETNI